MRKLKSIEEYQNIIQQGKNVLLFSADWCPDCRVIEHFLPELEETYSEYQFIYVDRDEFLSLCGDLGVFGIPSFVAFQNGEEIGRFVSKDRKSKEQIEEFMDGLTTS
ncbi:thiol reductase thioredoxin [Pontibacillus yanchengensis]|uniref:Thiol reductase thioredoxin n=2 Tax=Pontibacillus yanchengensis TaxID=462910 RepID=A0ACC7VG38_9BACI|nr:thioredoxin family protein [Pontibacillus yanchengensis]MYL34076.1 thiol reductase thioredoxin [Pontibacillus yanchengensis]MYL53164.1 thiol reductase thioredoxin [Pontibacillus yanchengensis]